MFEMDPGRVCTYVWRKLTSEGLRPVMPEQSIVRRVKGRFDADLIGIPATTLLAPQFLPAHADSQEVELYNIPWSRYAVSVQNLPKAAPASRSLAVPDCSPNGNTVHRIPSTSLSKIVCISFPESVAGPTTAQLQYHHSVRPQFWPFTHQKGRKCYSCYKATLLVLRPTCV